MTSAQFKYIDRARKDLLVLIPGWASDHRIFASLNLEFNYLIPLNFSPFTFEKELLKVLAQRKIKKISLFGWSLGGFVAAEFAAKYSNLIDQIILVSIRRKYQIKELQKIKKRLSLNKKGYLYKFYVRCFAKKEQMSWFRGHLLRDYCDELDLVYLFQGLDYLENSEIKPDLLNTIERITIVHGQRDIIASLDEAIAIKDNLTQARFICIRGAGHIPFLKKDFNKIYDR
jgi:malonyl-CoA O-methyltransferase